MQLVKKAEDVGNEMKMSQKYINFYTFEQISRKKPYFHYTLKDIPVSQFKLSAKDYVTIFLSTA